MVVRHSGNAAEPTRPRQTAHVDTPDVGGAMDGVREILDELFGSGHVGGAGPADYIELGHVGFL